MELVLRTDIKVINQYSTLLRNDNMCFVFGISANVDPEHKSYCDCYRKSLWSSVQTMFTQLSTIRLLRLARYIRQSC